jgi:hypothetical protein
MSRLVRPGTMLHSPVGHIRQNIVAYLALFVALGGTSAYAANEWNSSNIQNETLLSEDIKDGTLKAQDYGVGSVSGARIQDNNVTTLDLADGAIFGNDVRDGSLTGTDIANESIGAADIGSQQVGPDEVINDSLLQSDIRAGAVTGDEVLDNSLTGTDINESTLNMPPTTTATFASNPSELTLGSSFTKVASKNLPAGSWAIVATANTRASAGGAGPFNRTAVCELRNGTSFIGGTTDRRVIPASDSVNRSLSMNGGAQVLAGGGEVSLWCNTQGPDPVQFSERVTSAQMMMIRLDGFS